MEFPARDSLVQVRTRFPFLAATFTQIEFALLEDFDHFTLVEKSAFVRRFRAISLEPILANLWIPSFAPDGVGSVGSVESMGI